MADKIRAVIIFEMLGAPPKYLNEMLLNHLEKLGKEKGIKILSKRLSEPKKVEEAGLFTSFVESELELEDVSRLMNVIFAYMPSHIDVISPESLRMSNYDLNVFGNELIRRLHQYDEMARIAQIQNAQLAQNMQNSVNNREAGRKNKTVSKKKKR